MGVAIRDIITAKDIKVDDLAGKPIAIDSYNMLYQFITTIRGPDGSPLTDSKGNITSHLVGLFSRAAQFLQKNLKPVFVFDGEVPQLKRAELDRRKELKQVAADKYEAAKAVEDVESMKKFAARTSRLTKSMVDEAKELVTAMGFPIVQAPSEGEAQAAYMTKKGDCYATISQDFDSLLHGAPRLVRNLSIAGKRKRTGKIGYVTVSPELIELSSTLNTLGIDNDQLIALAMLVGTDYNIGGIKGIGPKKGIELVKKHGKDFDKLFAEVRWAEHTDNPWEEVYYLIKKLPVTDDYELTWQSPDFDAIKTVLVTRREFSLERVESTFDKIRKQSTLQQQKGLSDFF
ncbi:MAG: flap endonuclease-1 [archaeon]